MNKEPLRTIGMPAGNPPSFSELRNAIYHYDQVIEGDAGLLLEATQHIVDEARMEITDRLDGSPDSEQVRYFEAVVKALRVKAGHRVVVPDYEVIADPDQHCQVSLRT